MTRGYVPHCKRHIRNGDLTVAEIIFNSNTRMYEEYLAIRTNIYYQAPENSEEDLALIYASDPSDDSDFQPE